MKNKPFYKFFAEWLYKETGIQVEEKDQKAWFERRIGILINHLKLDNPEAAYKHVLTNLIKPSPLYDYLIDLFTNNETYFNREPKVFHALVEHIIPNILKKDNNPRSINIWSAGCSYGQEPYSIIMTILNNFPHLTPEQVHLVCTDISPGAITMAKEGIYNELDIQRGLPKEYLQKYFNHLSNSTYQVKESLRNSMRFTVQNLFNEIRQPCFFDIIFCRNVLIYHSHRHREKILKYLSSHLKNSGVLFLGTGESLSQLSVPLEPDSFNHARFYTKLIQNNIKIA